MGLRIGQFVTQYRVSRRHQREAQIVDRFVRERLPLDLAHHLGPSLSRQPAIVRIRYLPIKLTIAASDLKEEQLSLAWTQAFSRALFTALAYPTGAGPFEIFRADSLAQFLAKAIRDLVGGATAGHWEYAEFEEIFRMGSAQGSLTLLCEWPQETMSVLLALENLGALDGVLTQLDDLGLERVFAALARTEDADPPPLTLGDLISAAQLVRRHPPQRALFLRHQSYALRLFVQAREGGQPARSPRALFHSLVALHLLLEDGGSTELLHAVVVEARQPPAVLAILRTIEQQIQSDAPQLARLHQGQSTPQLARLMEILDDLRAVLALPLPPPAPAKVRWISSEWCGMFYLCGTLDRLGWIPAWRQLQYFQRGGISCLIAGLALAVAGKFENDPQALDPGLTLFSGYIEDPDLAHLRTVFQEYPREVRSAVLQAALPEQATGIGDENWTSTFDVLAESLIRSFAARIRGFRQASRQNIVRSFIYRPGRIRLEPQRVVVLPESSPFHVALHVSGMDAPLESVSWLDGRRLEFQLGDT
jgi:hypothetical protein